MRTRTLRQDRAIKLHSFTVLTCHLTLYSNISKFSTLYTATFPLICFVHCIIISGARVRAYKIKIEKNLCVAIIIIANFKFLELFDEELKLCT